MDEMNLNKAQSGLLHGAGSIVGGRIGQASVGESGSGCAMQDSEYPRINPTVRVSVEVRAVRNFADALMSAMDGKRATRAGWNAGGQYIVMQIPDKGSKMNRPYLNLKNAQNEMVPWAPSQGDLFASDWAILPN